MAMASLFRFRILNLFRKTCHVMTVSDSVAPPHGGGCTPRVHRAGYWVKSTANGLLMGVTQFPGTILSTREHFESAQKK